MRTAYLILTMILATGLSVSGQVKIGDNPQNIDPNSVLELESSSRVLVISRMGDSQMNSLNPLRGALVYNTDTQCVHYYDGTQWVNLCSEQNTTNVSLTLNEDELVLTDSDGNTVSVTLEGVGVQTFSADPVVNNQATVVITQTGDNFNFEVGTITGENIVDGSINGFLDIQFNSISADQLAPNSVGQEELQDNTVADAEIDYDQVTLIDFNNDAGFITGADIVSGDTPNAIVAGSDGGAFYDDSGLQTQITNNETAITNHIANDGDLDDQNELVVSGDLQPDGTLLLNRAGGNPPVNIDLSPLDNAGTDNQDLANVLSVNNSAGGLKIEDLGQPTFNNDAATKLYVDNQISTSGGTTEFADQATIIGNGAVGNEFRVGSIGSAEITNGTIQTVDIANNSITTAKIINGEVQTVDLANNSITTQKIANGAILGDDIAQQGATLDQVLKWNGTTWVPSNDATGSGGTIFTPGNGLSLDGSDNLNVNVDNSTIAVNTSNQLEVPDGAIDSNKIQNGTIALVDLSNMGASTNEILKWNGSAWIPAPDETGSGGTTFTPGNGLSLDGSDNLNVNVDGTTIDIVGNILQVADLGIDTGQLENNAVTSAKIDNATILAEDLNPMGAADGDVLKWDDLSSSWITAPDNDSGSGTTSLADRSIFIGNGSNVATPQFIGGDANLANDGTLTIVDDAVTSAKILDGEIVDADVSTAAAIQGTKIDPDFGAGNITTTGTIATGDATITGILATSGTATVGANTITAVDGTNGQVLTTDGAGNATWQDPASGAVEVTAAFTGNGTTGNALDLADDAVTSAKILDGEIVDADVSTAAAIQGTKIDPDFGAGNITTTGTIATGDATITGTLATSGTATVGANTITAVDGTNGQVLTTDGAGNATWQDPAPATVTASAGSIFFSDGSGGIVENNAQLFWDNTNERLNVGVPFVNNVDQKLNVNGVIRTTGYKASNGSSGLPAYRFTNNLDTGMFLADASGILGFSANNAEAMRIDASQNVGIGETNPLEKLHVGGNIRADGDILYEGTTTDLIPDYVFQKYFTGFSEIDPNYTFKSLADIENFLKKNHHLPGIKSAAQVKEEGVWNLSESNIQNLEKIEELFLHTIEQEKKIKTLQTQNKALNNELQAIKKDMAEIKAMLQAQAKDNK